MADESLLMTARSDSAIPTTELAREALADARELIRIEVALAKEELTHDLRALKVGVILGAGAVVSCLLGLSMLLMAVALTLGVPGALACGAGLILVAVGLGAAAFAYLPKAPLKRTRARVPAETTQIREHLT
jgi:Putative Actinobacterial Holin-X, holin superfamily III